MQEMSKSDYREMDCTLGIGNVREIYYALELLNRSQQSSAHKDTISISWP